MAREADRLASEEQSQADRMRKTFGDLQNGNNRDDERQIDDNLQELRQLGQDRQKLSDDFRISKQMQGAERDLASNQRPAAPSFAMRSVEWNRATCLTSFNEAADWLNRGVDPNANSTESEIGQGLAATQLANARRAAGGGQRPASGFRNRSRPRSSGSEINFRP